MIAQAAFAELKIAQTQRAFSVVVLDTSRRRCDFESEHQPIGISFQGVTH
jgi:hypothetical protein